MYNPPFLDCFNGESLLPEVDDMHRVSEDVVCGKTSKEFCFNLLSLATLGLSNEFDTTSQCGSLVDGALDGHETFAWDEISVGIGREEGTQF